MAFPRALPTPRTPDSMDAPPLRWGILGSGWIADRFTHALRTQTRQVIQATGSRSLATAQESAARFGAHTAYGSYAALVADPQVDVVYVATPHHLHPEHARLAIEAGKHVLVEKPVGLDAADARAIGAAAEAAGVMCLEAMWMLFLPRFDVVRQVLADGLLGRLHTVASDFGEWFPADHRIMDPTLGGGPLLDLGTYNCTLTTWALGSPDPGSVTASGSNGDFGLGRVNLQLAATATFDDAVGTLHTTMLADTPTSAFIAGDEATLTLDRYFYRPGPVRVAPHRGDELIWDEPRIDHVGLHYEAAELARVVDAGGTSSPLRPWAETVRTLEFMDAIRERLGLDWPAARADRTWPAP